MQFQHTDNKQNGEFFLENEAGKRIAEITYLWSGEDKIIAEHTQVDDSLRGQGVARQLLDSLVTFARQHQLRIVPKCEYVEVMFKRDLSLADVAAS